MPAERYYIDSELTSGDKLQLIDQEFHHLAHVMRASSDDVIELVNGFGKLAKAKILDISKRSATILIEEIYSELAPEHNVILIQGIPRLNRLDMILEKGTELGMTEIWLLASQYSERISFTEKQLKRFHLIVIAAMKQSGRLFLPKIKLAPPLCEWKDLGGMFFFGDLNPDAPSFFKVLQDNKNVYLETASRLNQLYFAVGPEKGFSKEEINRLQSLKGIGVKLNPHILRTDTAAITALSLLCASLYT